LYFCDPQSIFLLKSFTINGVWILDDLITEAKLTQNVVFERYFPNLFGGTTFTATRAFSGNVFDNKSNLVPRTEVGFGVFETNFGLRFFSPIIFAENISAIKRVAFFELDLSPVISESLSGFFSAEGLILQTIDAQIVNRRVELNPIESTFTVSLDTNGCPDGFVAKFSFDASLINASEMSIAGLEVKVATLTNGNLLQNANGRPAGIGVTLAIPNEDDFSDGILNPGESVDVPFSICLKELKPFGFFVDVLGVAF